MSSLREGVQQYLEKRLRSFHTPGHKGRREFFYNIDFPAFDLTELPGLDMLHSPEGIIKEAQERCAEIFGAEESFFLVDGGTAGNQAMMMALPADGGKRVLVERQAHRSVSGGLVLSGLKPDYLEPVIHPDFNLPLGIKWPRNLPWERYLACQITYPTYYGTVPPLERIVAERDNLGPEIPLLVDQAHGSHYLNRFFPPSAVFLGADMVLNSAHKTLSALTQAALLHVQGHRFDRSRLRQCLELLQSSSPSYLLLVSLEAAGEYALQEERWAGLYDEVQRLHEQMDGRLRVLGKQDVGSFGITDVDWSKILVNTRPLGLKAEQCVSHLRSRYGIEPELWDQENILFMLGIGNTVEDIKVLREGLLSLSDLAKTEGGSGAGNRMKAEEKMPGLPPVPVQRLTPREAFLASKESVALGESLGRIAGETISPYPPGIPWIIAGEEVSEEVLEALKDSGKSRFQGWQGKETGRILVVKEGKSQ